MLSTEASRNAAWPVLSPSAGVSFAPWRLIFFFCAASCPIAAEDLKTSPTAYIQKKRPPLDGPPIPRSPFHGRGARQLAEGRLSTPKLTVYSSAAAFYPHNRNFFTARPCSNHISGQFTPFQTIKAYLNSHWSRVQKVSLAYPINIRLDGVADPIFGGGSILVKSDPRRTVVRVVKAKLEIRKGRLRSPHVDAAPLGT